MPDIRDFLSQQGLSRASFNFEAETARFLREMEDGLEGTGSLKMIPSFIDPFAPRDTDRRVIAVDAGGTNLRVALVSFSKGNPPEIRYFEQYRMPGRESAIRAEDFFDLLAEYLEPVIQKADYIGICFSFPAEILPNRDARILYFDKEIQIIGAEGLLLGENLRAALKRRGLPHEKSVVVVNDTVAALLGAVTGCEHRCFSGYAALVLGTGVNAAYPEENRNIHKLSPAGDGYNIVNLESGGYNKYLRSDTDLRFDAGTERPGDQAMEKMVSGAYQGPLALHWLRVAANAGCFSSGTGQALSAIPRLSGEDITVFFEEPFGEGSLATAAKTEQDRDAVFALLDALTERTAFLITVSLAAILKKMNAGKRPVLPVCIAAEGTTFYRAGRLQPKIVHNMTAYVTGELGYFWEFVKVDNGSVIGTAAAGLY